MSKKNESKAEPETIEDCLRLLDENEDEHAIYLEQLGEINSQLRRLSNQRQLIHNKAEVIKAFMKGKSCPTKN